MSSKTSTMFLNDVTVIDLAVLDEEGRIGGHSVRPRFRVTGNIDPTESVVVDFSTIKKQIKALIDHPTRGYDHKLVVARPDGHQVTPISSDWSLIETDSVHAKVPNNAVRICDVCENVYDIEAFAAELSQYLEREFLNEHSIALQIKVDLDAQFEYIESEDYASGILGSFTYTHGLKSSTSWGCQNIAHGHFSFIQFLKNIEDEDQPDHETAASVMTEIEEFYGAAVFIFRENVIREDNELVHIGYSTERGEFEASYKKATNNIIILETETTIEYLVAEIASKFGDKIKAVGYTGIAVSEGLTKGAIVTL